VDRDEYRRAAEAAEEELVSVTTQISALTQRRAQLLQTISALKNLLGDEPDDLKITGNIRVIFQATNNCLTATEVFEKLGAMGVAFTGKNPLASVQTIIARMARPDGEVERVARPDGTLAYIWRKPRPPFRNLASPPEHLPSPAPSTIHHAYEALAKTPKRS
jgi:hypothetical protein